MYKRGACVLSLILGISPQILNSGTPFPNASHSHPILQGRLMGVVWVAGGPTSLGVPRIFPGICLLETRPGGAWHSFRHAGHMECGI